MGLFSFESDQDAQNKENDFLAAQNEQLASKSRNLQSVDRQIQGDKEFLQQIGEQPPAEPGRGWLPTLLDTLDTPHQWVQGLIAKGTGTKGYSDLGWLDAAAKGGEEDLRTADLLRRNGIMEHSPISRGLTGFLGDIVTDPLQWVTGFPQVAGIGGKAFGEEAIPTLVKETGETPAMMFERIKQAQFQKLLPAIEAEDIAKNPQLRTILERQAYFKANKEARALFEGAQSYQRDAAQFARSGASAIAPEKTAAALAEKAKLLGIGSADESLLALPSVEDISKLHQAPTIRFTSPLMGIPGIEKLPIIGTREADIPIVSDAVRAAREALANGYYGAKMKVGNWVDKSLAEASGGDVGTVQKLIAQSVNTMGKVGDSASRLVTGLASNLSRRITATGSITGDRTASQQIMQHERDRNALLTFTQLKSAIMGHEIMSLDEHVPGTSDAIFRHITSAIDSAGDMLAEGSIIPAEKADTIRQALAQRISDPKQLAAATKFSDYIQAEYARLAQKELAAGLIENARDAYLPHIYDLEGSPSNFSMSRKYRSLAHAKANGMKPNENALHLLTARKFASELAFAQKDFAERMAFQWGVNPEVYNTITNVARNGVQLDRQQALRAIKQLGTVNNSDLQVPAMMLKGELVPGTEGVYKSGRVFDGDTFDAMREIINSGDGASKPYQDVLEQTSDLLKLPDGSSRDIKDFINDESVREQAESMAQRFEATQRSIPGYDGESTFARAGATTIAPFMKQKMLKNIEPGDEVLWNNLVPNHLAHALEESYHVGDSLKRWVEKNAAGKAKNGFVRGVDEALGFLGGFNKVLKQGALSIWPARYVRDLASAGFQSGLVSSPLEQVVAAGKNLAQLPLNAFDMMGGGKVLDALNLGEHLNYHSIVQGHEVINGGRDLVTSMGKTIPNQQLMMEAVKAGFEWNGNYSTDLVATMNDMLAEMAASPAIKNSVPGIGRYSKGNTPATAVQKGANWLASKAGMPLEDRFWQKFPEFGERLERYGRTNTFINLRSRGFEADEAAALANRMHIDYRNAKTPVERKFMNNLFFFYSFSRGNASSLMTALMRKPGALTTQLHAFHAVGEMLKDPNAFVDDPDIEEKVRSNRLAESMSMYLGKNADTNLPQFLSGSGLPVEDLSKFSAISLPTSFSSREVIRAGADSAKKTTATLVGQANPFIRTAVEVMSGRNFFYDRPITDETLRKIPKWEKDSSILNAYPFRAVPNEVWHGLDAVTKEVLDAKDNGDGTWTVNPYNLSVLTVLAPGISSLAPGNPIVGALSPLKYSSRFLNTRKMLSEPGVPATNKWLRLMTGVHVDEIDPDASRLYDEKKNIDEYMDFIGVPKGQRRRAQMKQAETEGEE